MQTKTEISKGKKREKKRKLEKRAGNKIRPIVGIDEGEDTECLVCGLWWHNALPGENLIRCVHCWCWVHEACSWKCTEGHMCNLC